MAADAHSNEGPTQREPPPPPPLHVPLPPAEAHDALVLTKSARTFSVGLLSQTYNAGQQTAKAPIITRFKDNYQLDLSVNTEAETKEAETIFRNYSVFDHFAIGAQLSAMPDVGTRIIIFHLRKEGKEGATHDTDDSDDDDDALAHLNLPLHRTRVAPPPRAPPSGRPLGAPAHSALRLRPSPAQVQDQTMDTQS